jgi:V/A-type H+-transporting ATPase subunit G/H
MAMEKSLLQQIREKELQIRIRLEDTRREAEEIIINARKEAAEMIETSEREGKAAAQEYYEQETESIRKENEQLKKEGNQQAVLIKERGERELPKAIEKIVKSVLIE